MLFNQSDKNNTAQLYALSVLSGPHCGAHLKLSGQNITISGADDSDYILSEFQSGALQVVFDKNRVRIRFKPVSVGAKISINGTRGLGEKTSSIPLPCLVELPEGTRLHLWKIPQRSVSTIKRWVLTVGVVMIAFLSAAMYVSKALAPNSAIDAIASAETDNVEKVVDTFMAPAAPIPVTPQPSALEVVSELELYADSVDLASLIIMAEEGIIRISGDIRPDQERAWFDFRQRAETSFGIPIVSTVKVAEFNAPLAVTSVWVGDAPFVVTRDGRRHMIGDLVGDGWVIDTITLDAVLLVRGRERVVVEF